MAITPDIPLSQRENEIAELELSIDRFLFENFDGTKELGYNLPKNSKEGVIKELIKKYREKGWGVYHFVASFPREPCNNPDPSGRNLSFYFKKPEPEYFI